VYKYSITNIVKSDNNSLTIRIMTRTYGNQVHKLLTIKQLVSLMFCVNLITSSLMFSLQIVLKPLLDIALNISQLEKFTGRNAPTVIT